MPQTVEKQPTTKDQYAQVILSTQVAMEGVEEQKRVTRIPLSDKARQVVSSATDKAVGAVQRSFLSMGGLATMLFGGVAGLKATMGGLQRISGVVHGGRANRPSP